MAFSITTAETELTLSADRKASATFTVSNTSGVAILPAKAEIVASDIIAQDWITIEGEATKHFAISTTHQFTVAISIPETADPGQYTFRLNMIGIENPDEHFSQGPAVSFVVPATPDQEPEPRSIPWLWLGIGVGVLVLLTGLAVWQFFKPPPPGQVRLDSYIGSPLSSAQTELENSGFSVVIKGESNSDYSKYVVFSQEPDVGDYDEGSSVVLHYSNDEKTVRLVNLVGKKLDDAKKQLTEAGFDTSRAGSITSSAVFQEGSPKGIVVSQNPDAGGQYFDSQTIHLNYSDGRSFVGNWKSSTTPPYGTSGLPYKALASLRIIYSGNNRYRAVADKICTNLKGCATEAEGVRAGSKLQFSWRGQTASEVSFVHRLDVSLSGKNLKGQIYTTFGNTPERRSYPEITFTK